MRGAGTKLLITKNSPAPAHLLDVTRTVSRAGQRATGIDRIERAYIAHLAADPAPLFGLVRTRLGFLLLDRDGCSQLLTHCEEPMWQQSDLLSRLTRRSDPDRAVTEAGLRKIAIGRAVPSRLGKLLNAHLPAGTVYLNTGQTNLNDTVIHGLRTCPDRRIVCYLHDTIPLDYPDTQTQKSRLKFKRFFGHVDRHADLVLCNSADTKAHILQHSESLTEPSVEVLYPGLPDMTVGSAPQGAWTGNPYFLAIGTIEPRKSIGFLIDLWKEFSTDTAPHLLICGRRGWMSDDIFQKLDAGIPNVHEMPDLTDPELWALLQDSSGLLFPSRAEGFGYPAVEAAHLGVPLVCTPLAAFREVLGDYPIYASRSDCYVWINKIEQLAQRRQVQSGEQNGTGAYTAPDWQAHFNRLFTLL
jgi:glycosyltransferase involved in cell wall biosynthesis